MLQKCYEGFAMGSKRFAGAKAITLFAVFGVLISLIHVSQIEGASAKLGSIQDGEFSDELQPEVDRILGFNDNDLGITVEKAMSGWKKYFTKKDLRLMSAIIYAEANGMGFDAKVAVGNVVLNRMNDGLDGEEKYGYGYVTTIEEVIYDHKWGYQFSPVKDGSMDKALKIYDSMDPDKWKDWQIRAMNECKEAAKAALGGWKTVPDSYLYFNLHIETQSRACLENGWGFSVIERHIYYNKVEE